MANLFGFFPLSYMTHFYIFMLILSQKVKKQGVFNKLLSFYYSNRVIELLKLHAIENCYSFPLMLN